VEAIAPQAAAIEQLLKLKFESLVGIQPAAVLLNAISDQLHAGGVTSRVVRYRFSGYIVERANDEIMRVEIGCCLDS
jgi:hypothetical protein